MASGVEMYQERLERAPPANEGRNSPDRRLFEVVDQTRVSGMDAIGATLSHELNQPLTALMIYLQSLQRQLGNPKAPTIGILAEVTDKAVREAERAIDIVRRMRRLSLRSEPDRQPIALSALVEDTLEMAMVGVGRLPAIERRLRPDMPTLLGDPVQIRQIIVNLVRNAAEATATVPQPRITIESDELDGMAYLTVSDNGPGIDSRMEGRLFRAFETSKPHGQGLGLAISRMIAQNHGGDLVMKSRAGTKGASFALKLPLK